MTAHLIAWIPPEGCDVLASTVGGGQAPFMCRAGCSEHGHRWRLPGARLCCAMAGLNVMAGESHNALLLQYDGQPVRAGMDAGRAVLAQALDMECRYGVRVYPHGREWRIAARLGDGFAVTLDESVRSLRAPEALALALIHHVGGRAILADADGREAGP